jgi:protein-S-isoprenylcysteine O-methyltransferase Ste14
MTDLFYRACAVVWIAAAAFWAVGAARGGRADARRERPVVRAVHLSLMTLAFVLLFGGSIVSAVVDGAGLPLGSLRHRFVPAGVVTGLAGLVLTVAGCALAVWARALLGRNWSGAVTLKAGHELVRTGPYALVRHPIYSGFLLAMLGTALALGEVRGLAAFALAFVAWFAKACREERVLGEQFGEQYVGYCGATRRFVPYLF